MLTTRAAMPVGLEPPMRLDAQRHFAAGREQQHVGPPVGRIQQNVGAALRRPSAGAHLVRSSVGTACRVRISDHRLVTPLHDDAPRFDHFVRIGRAQDDQTGNRAERGQLLDGLVGRPVLADSRSSRA